MTIMLVPHQTHWAAKFETFKRELATLLDDFLKTIEHFGSTAVPGIAAKPIIDIIGTVTNLSQLDMILAKGLPSYIRNLGENGLAERRYLVIHDLHGEPQAHVHLFKVGSQAYSDRIIFRDHLRANLTIAREYEALKKGLAERFRHDQRAYWDGKASFVETVLARAKEQQMAEALGFPKPEYRAIERERRWLCREVPRAQIVRTEVITDLYVTGTRLRLREARPLDGTPAQLRLTRKADVDMHTRLITSIYLPEGELAILAASLPGKRLRKLRHRLGNICGATLAIDEFEGDLTGLVLVEAEFKTSEQLTSFSTPDFALREVTDDPRYTGGNLVRDGLTVAELRELSGSNSSSLRRETLR